MDANSFPHPALPFLPFKPNAEQNQVLDSFMAFADFSKNTDDVFILQGSAGTGKTSITTGFVQYLRQKNIQFFLCAPTARAAKIIHAKTKIEARTIHSTIYIPEKQKNGMGIEFVRKMNLEETNTIYFIDEASMVSNELNNSEGYLSKKPLLTDLLGYIKQGNSRNKIVFIGDTFQLPPVGSMNSPALDEHYLLNTFGLIGFTHRLTQVMRQDEHSYILQSATQVRDAIAENAPLPPPTWKNLRSISEALRMYLYLYDADCPEKVGYIAFYNKSVNWWNKAVRQRLFKNPKLLEPGDWVIVNRTILMDNKLVLKGDLARVIEANSDQWLGIAGLTFFEAELEFTDASGVLFRAKTQVLAESLISENGQIPYALQTNLYNDRYKNNAILQNTHRIEDDPFLNALEIRYGYALTCHKAQGGEWDHVIVNPVFPADNPRWLYTAITRASKELYAIPNF